MTTLEHGQVVSSAEVLGIHSTTVCEDGRTILRLYYLTGNRTGSQVYVMGEAVDHSIRVAD